MGALCLLLTGVIVSPASAATTLTFWLTAASVTSTPGAVTNLAVGLGTDDGTSPSAALTSDVGWLTTPSPSAATPAQLAVAVDASAMPAGEYLGTLTASAAGYAPARYSVTLTVTGTVSVTVNFQAASSAVPVGYMRDSGQAYGARTAAEQGGRGLAYGWVTPGTSTPVALETNGRTRGRKGIAPTLDSIMHMQGDQVVGFTGVRKPGAWEVAVPNGDYDVTVAVGDAPSNGVYDSAHTITAEGAKLVDRFQATANQEYKVVTSTVTVADGRLTLDPTGGTNTKIDYVAVTSHAAPPPDTVPPAAPADVRAVGGDSLVHLSWTANLEPDLADYDVFRGTSQPVPTATPVNAARLTVPDFFDSGVSNGQSYFYVVQAVDTSGNRRSSATVQATPLQTLATSIKVNFQDAGTTVPSGYVRDSGQSYGPRGGGDQGTGLSYGWVLPGTQTPVDLSGNGRNRNLAPTNAGLGDLRLATLMQMQYSGTLGNPTKGAWELGLPDGAYSVTVAAGDASYSDSSITINVEGQSFVTGFKPTAAQRFQMVTRSVSVTDGRLTIDALGGTNSKVNYVDVVPDVTSTLRPTVRSVSPSDGATNVRRDAPVVAEVVLPNVGAGVDAGTLSHSTVRLTRVSDGFAVPAIVNTTGGGDAIVLQPRDLLDAGTQYRFGVTSGVRDLSGAPFVPTSVTFTTGTVGGASNNDIAFTKVALSTARGKPFTSVQMGPDGKLYASTLDGEIDRFVVNADGTLGAPQVLTALQDANGGARSVTGFSFDPTATASNLVLWVSNNAYSFNNAPDWSGKVTRMSGPDLAAVVDYVVGLPRSVRDHETNSVVTGPDGALYLAQGAMSSGGAPDNAWGMRPEHLLSAAILRIDPTKITRPPLDVRTDEAGSYDPFAPGAPVTIYASGVRNAFDLLFHSNGKLYAPTNGSATGGNIPATPSTLPGSCTRRVDSATKGPFTGPATPAVTGMTTAEDDWMHVVVAGGYYGHPNPARCEYVFNGGNPTAGVDPGEATDYPVGVLPDRSWSPSYDLGAHYSPNGVIEYKSDVFGPALKGKIIVARYSAGKDLQVLTPAADGSIAGALDPVPGMTGLDDPLDVTEDTRNGNLYVTELGSYDVVLLRPGRSASGTPHVVVPPTKLVFNAVSGAAPAAAKPVVVQNTGDGALSISGLRFTGPDAASFAVESAPSLPLTVPAGQSVTLNVSFTATRQGPAHAVLAVDSNDPTTPTVQVPVDGLGTAGLGGTLEPSLQWILDTQRVNVDVGDPDPSTSSLPNVALTGSEVPLQSFVKLDPDRQVTATPLGVFGPTTEPVLHAGWYPAGNPAARTELFTVPKASAQSLMPTVTGTTTFDPGATEFGFWTTWPYFGDRLVTQEDADNTWTGALPHQVRVFPVRDANGDVVPGSYVVATEESAGDWNDVPLLVTNVKPRAGVPVARLTNRDGAPGNDRMVFSRIGSTLTNTYSVHDLVTARVSNNGTADLTVTGVTVTGAWTVDTTLNFPTVLPPGRFLDVPIRFVATSGGLQTGALTVTTNDPAAPALSATLAGYWQSVSEGGQEPTIQQVFQLFGWSTVVVGPGQKLNEHGLVHAIGDEVLAPFWGRFDNKKPVAVRQLVSYRTQNASSIMKWMPKGVRTATNLFTNQANSAQSVLPPLTGSTSPAAGTFNPLGVFELKVDAEFSDPTRNTQTADIAKGCPGPCGHHVRFWPVKDATGAVVPHTWVLGMDYASINYDYQDNMYLVTNADPAP